MKPLCKGSSRLDFNSLKDFLSMCLPLSSCAHVNVRPLLSIVVVLCLAVVCLSFTACDRSYAYKPEGWRQQKKGLEWVLVEGDVKVLTWGINEFLANESISPEFEITNQARMPLVIESATLAVGRQAFGARLPGDGALQWRTVPPGSVKRISLNWTFSEPAWKVLGP